MISLMFQEAEAKLQTALARWTNTPSPESAMALCHSWAHIHRFQTATPSGPTSEAKTVIQAEWKTLVEHLQTVFGGPAWQSRLDALNDLQDDILSEADLRSFAEQASALFLELDKAQLTAWSLAQCDQGAPPPSWCSQLPDCEKALYERMELFLAAADALCEWTHGIAPDLLGQHQALWQITDKYRVLADLAADEVAALHRRPAQATLVHIELPAPFADSAPLSAAAAHDSWTEAGAPCANAEGLVIAFAAEDHSWKAELTIPGGTEKNSEVFLRITYQEAGAARYEQAVLCGICAPIKDDCAAYLYGTLHAAWSSKTLQELLLVRDNEQSKGVLQGE